MKVGDRVRWTGNGVVGAGTGRVTKLYPGYVHRDEDGDVRVPDHVAVLVDVLPRPWCYPGTQTFAPEASRLTKIA